MPSAFSWPVFVPSAITGSGAGELGVRPQQRMPITPFHFGLGAALHAASPRTVSFLSFCTTNVLIDLESLYNLVHHRHPVHAFLHTYAGATLAALGAITMFLALRWFASRFWLPDLFGWRSLGVKQVAVGAFLGAYTHVALDSIMHSDIAPFSPFSASNGLYRIVSLDHLHLLCVSLGIWS